MRRASFTGTNFRRRQKMEGVGGRKFFAREPFAEPRRKAAGRSDFLSSRISHKIGSSVIV